MSLSSHPTFKDLLADQQRLKNQSILKLLTQDPTRAMRYQFKAPHLQIDLSKHALDDNAWANLLSLLPTLQFKQSVTDLFAGNIVNWSENRSAQHPLLRAPHPPPAIQAVHHQMHQLAEQWEKHPPFKNILHLGIGGSLSGAKFLIEALAPYRLKGAPRYLPVSSLDAQAFHEATASISAQETLVILASKSLMTQETRVNFERTRAWFCAQGINEQTFYENHVYAIASQWEHASEWPIPPAHRFHLWDFIGGRYSWCSAMGLPVLLTIGRKHWQTLLSSAHDMDQHFVHTPLPDNVPVRLALLDYWYRVFHQKTAHALIPYAHTLRNLVPYVQQLEMESLGKRITQTGAISTVPTASIIWGGLGTESQHAFFQYLQQGTDFCPVDFWITASDPLLASHALAQSHTLLTGDPATDPARALPGNRPSTLCFMAKVTPSTLGALLALYEHKTYVLSLLSNINAFDQWGVEAGKAMSQVMLQALTQADSDSSEQWDPATQNAINWFRELNPVSSKETIQA